MITNRNLNSDIDIHYNTFIRLRSIKLLKYYLVKIEDAVVSNNFSELAYYNYMIEKEKKVLGVK